MGVERVYEKLIREHLGENRQMAIVMGPRQVGKTTASRAGAGDHSYLSWDRQSDRQLITRGPDAVAEHLRLQAVSDVARRVVFDEIHKYRSWRSFLKGFFDVYSDRSRSVVTGSARLGHFRRGGDSLMGRYFPYRMHPFTVAELGRCKISETPIFAPFRLDSNTFDDLLRFGGYPEPFLRANTRFYNRWRRLRTELLFREDLRDLTRIQEVGQVEVLGALLTDRVGQLLSYSNLAGDANVSVDTARRWVAALDDLYFCFSIRPWHSNVPKSLRKQPKVFMWDWSMVEDPGARNENFVASHLLKAVNWWTDIGLGAYELYYLRDKAKREVDFLVTKNGRPWFLVEVKSKVRKNVSPALAYFQNETRASHAFQVAIDVAYEDVDCFSYREPVEVPARTLLSQLI